jgi:hypothetical protein
VSRTGQFFFLYPSSPRFTTPGPPYPILSQLFLLSLARQLRGTVVMLNKDKGTIQCAPRVARTLLSIQLLAPPFFSSGLPSPACQHPNLASAGTTHSKLFFFLLPPFPISVPTRAFRLLFSQLARTSLFSASRVRYFSDTGRLKGVHLISSHLIADCQSYRDLHTVDT